MVRCAYMMPPGAQRVADALVHAVFQRNIDIGGEGFQPADAHETEHVIGILQRRAAIDGRR